MLRLHPSHQRPARNALIIVALLALMLAAAWLLPPKMHDIAGYLPLHILLETVAIVVAMLVFAVGWNAQGRDQPGSVILLACAFFGIGWLDFFHVLSYNGMPDFVTPSDPEKGLAFWLAARLMASVALLIVAVRPWQPFASAASKYISFAAFIAITALVGGLFLFHLDWMPRTFVPGQGLTAFKVIFEYALILLNFATAFMLWRRMREPLPFNASLLLGAVIVMAMSEFLFTLYATTTDFFNVLGHIYKVAAYLFLYRAVVVESIEHPYAQLRESENQLLATMNAIPDSLFELDLSGRYWDYRAVQTDFQAASPEGFIGRTVFDVLPADAAEVTLSALREASADGYSHGKEIELSVAEGKRWFELSVSRKQTARGQAPRFILLARDITQRRFAEDSLLKLSQAVEQSPNVIVISDLHANIEYANPSFTRVTGYSLEEVRGQNQRMLQSGKTPRATYDDMWAHLKRGDNWKGEFINRRKDGSEYTEMVWISPVRQPDGRVTNYLAIKEDVTEKKKAEEWITKLAHFDLLTELPNRSLLNEHVRHDISVVQRSNLQLTVMFLDLDNFKNINDTLGHSIGDEMLIQLAKRLKSAIREEDTVSRLGGDEFVLIFPGSTANNAAYLAGKILAIVATPFQIAQRELTVTSSIGIAMYPDDGEDFEALSKNADTAMYRAKHDGRNTFRFFAPEMQLHSARALQLDNALRYALQRDQLRVYYQPQIALQDGRVTGAEALMRWEHPELGMISPAEFIPIAETGGQMLSIGEWVLRTAVRQLKTWLDSGLPPLVVAVNLSAVQFKHPNLPDLVSKILEEEKLPQQYLELELTESVAMDDPQGAITVMNELHGRGIRMSLDDFGTGYSSLSQLKKFKVCKLKIDQSFVRDIIVDADDKAIVTAIINMAKSLGFQTIAEGVETQAQLDLLREQGCDEVQGYYFSKPLPAEEFEAFVRARLG